MGKPPGKSFSYKLPKDIDRVMLPESGWAAEAENVKVRLLKAISVSHEYLQGYSEDDINVIWDTIKVPLAADDDFSYLDRGETHPSIDRLFQIAFDFNGFTQMEIEGDIEPSVICATYALKTADYALRVAGYVLKTDISTIKKAKDDLNIANYELEIAEEELKTAESEERKAKTERAKSKKNETKTQKAQEQLEQKRSVLKQKKDEYNSRIRDYEQKNSSYNSKVLNYKRNQDKEFDLVPATLICVDAWRALTFILRANHLSEKFRVQSSNSRTGRKGHERSDHTREDYEYLVALVTGVYKEKLEDFHLQESTRNFTPADSTNQDRILAKNFKLGDEYIALEINHTLVVKQNMILEDELSTDQIIRMIKNYHKNEKNEAYHNELKTKGISLLEEPHRWPIKPGQQTKERDENFSGETKEFKKNNREKFKKLIRDRVKIEANHDRVHKPGPPGFELE